MHRVGQQAAARESAWRALQEPDGCVLLLGPRGVGKTQLAIELSLQAARKGLTRFPGSQMYRVLAELFRDEKRTFGASEGQRVTPIDRASDVGLLVLDEIQERFESAWEDRELTMLFDRRYRDMRRTILLANLTVVDAPKRLPASMWSRIVECGVVIECNWPSFRGGAEVTLDGAVPDVSTRKSDPDVDCSAID